MCSVRACCFYSINKNVKTFNKTPICIPCEGDFHRAQGGVEDMLVTRCHVIGESELLRTNFYRQREREQKIPPLTKAVNARPRANGGCRCKMHTQT